MCSRVCKANACFVLYFSVIIILNSKLVKKTAAKRKAPAKIVVNASSEVDPPQDDSKPPTTDADAVTATSVASNDVVSETFTDLAHDSFELGNKPYSLKICSWNVAGLRALVKKNGIDFLEQHKPDILCMQVETTLIILLQTLFNGFWFIGN